MSQSDAKSKQALGFLTVVEQPEYGLLGGYLLLNRAGRPLEFHCTAPIKPNRAQEILYGPTLKAFLFGEQIGRTLIEQAKTPPMVVCTDCEPALAAREYISSPFVLVMPPAGEANADNETGRYYRLDAAHNSHPPLAMFQLGLNRLALPERAEEDRRLVTERLADFVESFDLAEPFQRIRDAIEEARQAVR